MLYILSFTDTHGNPVGIKHTTRDYTKLVALMYQAQALATGKGIQINAHLQEIKEATITITPQKTASATPDTSNPYPKQGTSPSVCEILNRGD